MKATRPICPSTFTSIIRRVKTKLPESNNAAGTTVQNDLLINASFTEPPNQNEKSSHSFPADPECNTATYLFTINSNDIIKTVKMDNEPKSVSSIEEDIEEAITEASSDADQPDSKSKSNEAVMKKRQLFDLDPGDVSADFLIDDKALSGGGLTQHFHLDKSESLKETGRSRKDEVSERTENDVPEIDESSQLYTRSLDFKSSILNVDPHECLSLDSQLRVIQPRPSHEDLNQSFERDQLVEEVMESNHSVEMTLNDDELSSLGPHIDINDESQMNKILGDSHDSLPSEKNLPSENLTRSPRKSESEKLLASDNSSRSGKSSSKAENSKSAKKSDPDADELVDKVIVVKRMEQVKGDFFKEALDDITEESERQSQQCADGGNDNTSNDFDSIISLNMIQMLENKVKDLQEIVASKDVCLESLNMQLHSAHARDSFTTSPENRDSLRDLPPSGRDSSSLATTTSTEYRTLLDDFAPKVFNFPDELIQRDQLIEKLTESLQQSVKVREELQTQSEALSGEVQQLRKQLAETLEQFKKPYWPRDQESSTTGQRLSEIEIDLVSESDEDLGEHFLTDNEEKMSTSNRNSRERQLGDMIGVNMTSFENFEPGPIPASKQIEQFQKYLNSDEMRIYFMVQKKFDDYLSEEIEKVKMKYEAEIKMLTEQLEIEKCDKDFEGAPSEEMRRSTSPKQIDDELLAKSPVDHDGHNLTLVGDDDDISPCLIIEQDDVGINESQEIRDIAADYHRRLQEQVTLAKQDIVQELENHIQVSDKKMRFCHILFVELLVGMMI
ncbi:unnamed protein product [Hermetia illucens]|uniref:Uncharacterized protein n=1 Tax=Hermetia illucens TaxID=343691 RepID=A0A7R8YQB7_HERIL|nr:unnamed protein product [Hermetia illucens]